MTEVLSSAGVMQRGTGWNQQAGTASRCCVFAIDPRYTQIFRSRTLQELLPPSTLRSLFYKEQISSECCGRNHDGMVRNVRAAESVADTRMNCAL